jgi:filamentous hemagglutinin family protein
MNSRSYKTVFSKRLGALVAVGEHATSQGKANGASGPGASGAGEGAVSALAGIGYVAALSASFAFVSLAWAAPATNALPTNALPTGGTVVQGAASMSQNANQLNIQQSTQRAAINWQSFNIGAQAKVQVVQPNAQAVLLNRVVGQSPSQIFGQLQANGHVILVNPNGVLFGKDGSVNAGGFTASTLNISDANFTAGNMVYERNGSTAGIQNLGSITAEQPGGYVALLGATVSNEGSISTKGGSVVMGAGETIKVPVSGTGRIKLELTPAAINASLSNTGSIVTEGGQVYMQALALNRAAAQILQSGSIDTTGEKGGDVHVLADGGHIRVDGRIKANSTNGTAGGDIFIGRDKDTNVLAAVGDVSGARLESKGGFVETSGKFLHVDGARVIAKDWLLDPYNINIVGSGHSGTPYSDGDSATAGVQFVPGATSNILASDIVTNLNSGTSVTINTAGAGSDAGNIVVNAEISKTSGGEASLTLLADNGITVNQEIKSTSNKLNVTMKANGGGASSQGLVINKLINANGGAINLEGKTTNSAAAVTVASTALIQGASVTMKGTSTSGAAINGTGKVNATAGDVSITGTGNNGNGWAITTNNTITATGNIEINTTSAAKHGITLGGGVQSTGGEVTIYADVLANGSGVALSGNYAINAKNKIDIMGKTNGYFSVNGLGVITSSDGNVTVDGLSTGSMGVNLTNNISAVKGHVALTGSGGNAEGVVFGNGISINAKSYEVQGTTSLATSVGVKFNGTTTFNSSVDSKIEGANLAGGTGVYAAGSTININSGAGKVLVRNQTGTTTGGMELRSGTVVNTTGDVTFGRNDQANNALFLQALKATATGGKLTFLGSSSSKDGIGFQDFGGSVVDIKAINGAKILIDGKSTANGASGVNMRLGAGVSHLVTSSGVGGSIEIYGTSKLGKGVNADLAKITSNNGNAINITGTGGSSSDGIYIANAVTANDGGNINITGNTATNNGTGTAVSINNNGGAGKVEANGAAGVPAGKITITGDAGPSTGPGSGMGIFNSAMIKGGAVDMTGTGKGAGKAVYSFGAITSTVGGVSIKGTVTGSSGSIGTHIQGPLTAQTDINLEGYTAGPSQGLLIQSTAVTSTAGDITVKGENKWNDGRAVSIFDGHLKSVAGGKTININANTLFMTGTTSTSTSVDAGSTGTVNIKTLTPGNEIKIGSSDMGGAALGSQILRIDNGELNRITAGNTVIGDTASTGKITVAGATTTLGQTGNITLQTGGKIAVDAALTVGDTAATKNLTLNGAGATSTISQSAAIKAAGLELLGANATHILTNTGNDIKKLAGSTGTVSLTNKGDLEVSTVNTNGLTATGNVSITTTAVTGGQPGNLTLKKNLTAANVNLNAAGAVLRDATAAATDGIIKASLLNIKAGAGVGTSTSRIKTDVVDLSIDSVGDQYITEANAVNVAAKSTGGNIEIATTNGTLTVRTVNSITGITANGTGNVVLNGSATGADGGVHVLENIDAGGGISITGQSGTNHGVSVDAADLTANGPINITGTSGETNDVGVIIWHGSKITANNSGAYAYVDGANAISIRGLTSTSTVIGPLQRNVVINDATITNNSNNGNTYIYGEKTEIALDRQSVITNASSAGAIQIVADNNALISAAVSNSTPIAQITQNSDKGVRVTSSGAGNVEVANVLNNGKGDVVVGAGISRLAGDGTGGQVKTNTNSKITQISTGNTYIYSGSAADTGLLSRLDNSFSELRLSGDMGTPGTPLAQNADSNVKYAAGTTITGGAKAQVMFREKITLDTSTITDAALDKTYAGANTTSSAADKAALFAEMQAKLKQTNFGQIITRPVGTTSDVNVIKISKAALINDLSGSLSVPIYSTSNHLTAKTHEYGALSSTKYDTTLAAGAAKVEVAKLALTGSIAQSNSIYGDSLVAGTASFTNKVGSDVVNPVGVSIATTGNTSGSGNLNAGTYAGIQSVRGLDGNDAANYSFTNVKGDYKVDKRPLTIAPGSVATKTADGTTAATVTPGALSNLVGTETLGVAATGTFSDANAGNNKAVNAFYTLQNGANGGVASNYILALGKPGNPDTRMTGTILASVNPVTPIAPVNNNTGANSRVRTVSGFSGAGAATGVLDDTPVTESREVCSDVFPENCECQPSVIPSIEICFAPKSVAATKEEK